MNTNKFKLLVTDDDNMCLKSMTNFCSKPPISEKVELITAVDGKDAIEKVKNNKFDLIFIDIFMPNINGYEATAEIRKMENGKGRIIAMSGDDLTPEDLKKCGFDRYIKKPVSKMVFIKEIENFEEFLKTRK